MQKKNAPERKSKVSLHALNFKNFFNVSNRENMIINTDKYFVPAFFNTVKNSLLNTAAHSTSEVMVVLFPGFLTLAKQLL